MTKSLFISFFIAFITIANNSIGQEIVNVVFVNDQGITEKVEDAIGFVVIKQYPGNHFERLDYKMNAPLIKIRTYNDSLLTNLDGHYLEYYESGRIMLKGKYFSNMKHGDWYTYNDSGRIILKQVYSHGVLVKAEAPDSVKRDTTTFGDEREAVMKGKNAWTKYLVRRLTESNAAEKSLKGGEVRVAFRIDTSGRTTDIFLTKSVEFSLDEESISVIKESPKWEPAFQNGRFVNAYRVQPLTFVKGY
jgi:TonB family protein